MKENGEGRLTFARLLLRSTRWHWRAHALLACALAVAVAVMAGALVVGWSLEHTLRQTLTGRMWPVREVVVLQRPAGEGLAERLGKWDVSSATALRASATDEMEERLPVPARVWVTLAASMLPGRGVQQLAADEAVINTALAGDLGVQAGDTLVVRVDLSHTRPAMGLFAYREVSELTRLVRLRVKEVVKDGGWADFSLEQTQVRPRNVFVARGALGELGPTHLLAMEEGALSAERLAVAVRLEDLGLNLRAWREGRLLQSDAVVFSDAQQVALAQAIEARAIGTYIAQEIRAGDRHVSYGIIAAELGDGATLGPDEVVLNDWVAQDLGVKAGEQVSLAALVADADGSYRTQVYELKVAGVEKVGAGLFVGEVTSEVEGVTTAARMDEWRAPFPVDMKQVTPRDEAYWDEHRATPKAVVSPALLEEMWAASGHRGVAAVTAYALAGDEADLERTITKAIVAADPQWHAMDPRVGAEQASRGSADFAMLFVAMSMFLIVAAIVVAAGLARLGAQSRLAEAGLASALGIARGRWLAVMALEYLLVVVPGVVLGIAAGVVYAYGLLWLFAWLGAGVWEMPAIRMAVRPGVLLASGIAVGVMALALAAWQMRNDLRRPLRELIASVREVTPKWSGHAARRDPVLGLGAMVLAVVVVVMARSGVLPAVAGFFLTSILAIVGVSMVLSSVLTAEPARSRRLKEWRMHLRFARWEPRRVRLSFTLFTLGAFVLCAVALFRGATPEVDPSDRSSATGGFAARITSPLAYRTSLQTPEALARLGVELPKSARVFSLLSSGGTEGGCLNLAVPGEMQVLGVGEELVQRGGFEVKTSDGPANPWKLLQEQSEAIPVFGDEETMQWIAYRRLGEVFVMPIGGVPQELKLVGMVRGGLFSGQLLMSAENLRRTLPGADHYALHLVEAPSADVQATFEALRPLADVGMTLEETDRIIAAVHSVQTLYMTLFLALGAMGLLLGGVGAVVLMVRDANARRGDLALLRVLGLSEGQVVRALLAWHALPVAGGLATGLAAAVLGHLAMDRALGLSMALLVGGNVLAGVLLVMSVLARWLRPREIGDALRAAG